MPGTTTNPCSRIRARSRFVSCTAGQAYCAGGAPATRGRPTRRMVARHRPGDHGRTRAMQIEGSTILVTGASSGIGAALAPMLAARGATVGIVARRRERLEEVLAACRRHAPSSRMWVADLGDLALAERVAGEAWNAFGHLDALVNNAAIPKRKSVLALTADEIAHVMDVNFHSPVRMGQAVLPRMVGRKRGTIVNVSSLGGRLGIVHEAAYCAAKFALCGWSEVMAIDLAGTGVE